MFGLLTICCLRTKIVGHLFRSLASTLENSNQKMFGFFQFKVLELTSIGVLGRSSEVLSNSRQLSEIDGEAFGASGTLDIN